MDQIYRPVPKPFEGERPIVNRQFPAVIDVVAKLVRSNEYTQFLSFVANIKYSLSSIKGVDRVGMIHRCYVGQIDPNQIAELGLCQFHIHSR